MIKRIRRIVKRVYYIIKVSRKSGLGMKEVSEKMAYAKKQGISYKRYYEEDAYKKPITWLPRRGKTVRGKKEKSENLIFDLSTETGVPIDEIKADILLCKKMYSGKIGAATYVNFEMYRMSKAEKREFIKKLEYKDELLRDFRGKAMEYDKGCCSLAELEASAENATKFLSNFLSARVIESAEERVNSAAEIYDDVRSVALDMVITKYLFGLSRKEYLMFNLWGKSIKEKMEYIPDRHHTRIILNVNGPSVSDICNNKEASYTLLKKHYGRELISVMSLDDKDKFVKFANRHKQAVLKPYNSSKGNGVRKINFESEVDLNDQKVFDEYLEELIEENQGFIIEELINTHESLKALNPDSVNTVRVIAYNDGEQTKVDACLMRIGRAGSFVDNGGAGGILVEIDRSTGRLCSKGHDHEGLIFYEHPDTGIVFENYQLPKWDMAMDLIKKASETMGRGFVGWDITCTDEGKWIVIEVNGTPQFFGKQSTQERGALPDFISMVGADKYERFKYA